MDIAKLVLEYLRVLAWPLLAVGVVLLFRKQLADLLERIQHAELPGGVTLDIGEQVQDVKRLIRNIPGGVAVEFAQPTGEVALAPAGRVRTVDPAQLLERGLQPSPSGLDPGYYGKWLDTDPSMVLAGLRLELEIIAGNLAKAYDLHVEPSVVGHRLIQQLQDDHVLTMDQSRLFHKVYRICSDAVHGALVTRDQASDMIDAASVIAQEYRELLAKKIGDP